ncbi:hypothetical protein D3OALGA1CA_3586 [Olavius algarvensis associated proteobacterium Delta 3]|nr:hypothetical protein D3OALGB2SA_2286 [Olavius algarvensis associated proteobacterium Delta 3]CAB5136660.1 hypothetical protein D3OALGA1CA_3586 [Olavius algarvensis associated proteobacterium Delta 3]
MTHTSEKSRILFLDNLRYLMVLLVLILHAAISYSNFVPWWCVKEPNVHAAVFDVLILILDVFLMPVLFFIAGYFAISSFRKKGTRRFLKRKFKRLGLPLLIGIPLVSPSFSYIYHFTRNGFSSHMGFGAYWMDYLKTAGDFSIGTMTSIDQFSQSHLWFMSLLLFFFVVFGLCVGTTRLDDGSAAVDRSGSTSPGSILIILAVMGILSAVFALIGNMLFARPENPEPWVTIANLLQFQPDSVGTYILYFGVGIYASHKKWFITTKIPGHPAIWLISCALLSGSLLLTLNRLMLNFSIGIFLLYLLARSFLCVSFLAAFSSWAAGHWNRPSQFHRLLALNSYHIYMTHFLIVVIMQLVLAGWSDGSVFVKFGIVSAASILASFGISHYALRPYPRLSVVGIYTLFAITLITIRPEGL